MEYSDSSSTPAIDINIAPDGDTILAVGVERCRSLDLLYSCGGRKLCLGIDLDILGLDVLT
jgi:hypothetical protein